MSVVTPGLGGTAPGMSYAPPPPGVPGAPPAVPVSMPPQEGMPPAHGDGLPPPPGFPPMPPMHQHHHQHHQHMHHHHHGHMHHHQHHMVHQHQHHMHMHQHQHQQHQHQHQQHAFPHMHHHQHHQHQHQHHHPPAAVPFRPPAPLSLPPSGARPTMMMGGALPPPSSVHRMVEIDLGAHVPTPIDLHNAARPYGLLEKVTINKDAISQSYHAFVTYSSPRAAQRLNDKEVITVGDVHCEACISTQSSLCSPYDRPSTSLWVGFGSHDLQQDDIGKAFAQAGAGNVQKVDLIHADPANTYAIVTFCALETAHRAFHANPPVRVNNIEAWVEWFHPGEALGSATCANETSQPVPEELRKLVFNFDVGCPAMDEEIIGALEEQGLGKCDKVAMNMHAKGKVAYVCFNTVENATRCFDMYTRGDFVLDICTGLTLDWACNTPEVELDLVDAQDVPIKKAAKPSLRLLLTYPTREALTEIGGSQGLKAATEKVAPGGIADISCRDNMACIKFFQVAYSMKVRNAIPTDSSFGTPAAEYGASPWEHEGTDDTIVIEEKEASSGPQLPQLYGCCAPELAPAKTSKAPVDAALQREIDQVAEEYARTGVATVDSELCLRVPHAGYFKHRVEWAKQGVSKKSLSALQRLRAAAEKKPTEHRRGPNEYKNPDEIPFNNRQNILIIDETNLTFTIALTRLLNNGEKLVVTTKPKKEVLLERYDGAEERMQKLYDLGVKIGYGFNVTKGSEYEELPTPEEKFDAIIVNFPVVTLGGADVDEVQENQRYIRKILKHCPTVLTSRGCVYLTQLDGDGYREWETSKLGLLAESGLRLVNKFNFRRSEYPGYIPVLPEFDPAGRFKDAVTYVFGKKKKYDAYDPQEEREIEFEKLKERKHNKRDSTDSSDSEEPRKKKKKKKRRDEEVDEIMQIEAQPQERKEVREERRDDRRERDDRDRRAGDRGDDRRRDRRDDDRRRDDRYSRRDDDRRRDYDYDRRRR